MPRQPKKRELTDYVLRLSSGTNWPPSMRRIPFRSDAARPGKGYATGQEAHAVSARILISVPVELRLIERRHVRVGNRWSTTETSQRLA